MIKSKTYNIIGNYIQAPELAYTDIYVVKKDGLQQDLYHTDPNRAYIYSQSEGKIIFLTGGEKAFVIYKESSPVIDPIPGVCVPVSITPTVLSDAQIGVPYTRSYVLGGTPPYSLTVIDKPDWASVGLFTSSFVRLTGTPDVEGPASFIFSVSNCSGGSTAVQDGSFNVLPLDGNLIIRSESFSIIRSVTGITYVITDGFFPVTGASVVTATHGDYTGTITVRCMNISFPRVLRLKKNGATLETISIPSNGYYTFASQSYLIADLIEIILE